MDLANVANPRPLDFSDGPIVWVDCEMTGLNPKMDKILEIAVRTPIRFVDILP